MCLPREGDIPPISAVLHRRSNTKGRGEGERVEQAQTIQAEDEPEEDGKEQAL